MLDGKALIKLGVWMVANANCCFIVVEDARPFAEKYLAKWRPEFVKAAKAGKITSAKA